eukprot:m.55936 g.55936  ORF g.55936 m.55936 type:complete len:325 (-) comp11531_c0_seq2:305-1279(-)
MASSDSGRRPQQYIGRLIAVMYDGSTGAEVGIVDKYTVRDGFKVVFPDGTLDFMGWAELLTSLSKIDRNVYNPRKWLKKMSKQHRQERLEKEKQRHSIDVSNIISNGARPRRPRVDAAEDKTLPDSDVVAKDDESGSSSGSCGSSVTSSYKRRSSRTPSAAKVAKATVNLSKAHLEMHGTRIVAGNFVDIQFANEDYVFTCQVLGIFAPTGITLDPSDRVLALGLYDCEDDEAELVSIEDKRLSQVRFAPSARIIQLSSVLPYPEFCRFRAKAAKLACLGEPAAENLVADFKYVRQYHPLFEKVNGASMKQISFLWSQQRLMDC